MLTDPQSLLTDGHCYACYNASTFEILKLQLLAQISVQVNPANPVDPQSLISAGKCLECYGRVSLPQLMITVLLVAISGTVIPPATSAPVVDNSSHAPFITGTVSKSVQPTIPTSFDFYQSATGIGTPDSNPGGWIPTQLGVVPVDGGAVWDAVTSVVPINPHSICKFHVGTIVSPWSNVI
jgi:hypothetical protein